MVELKERMCPMTVVVEQQKSPETAWQCLLCPWQVVVKINSLLQS
jgi:hypothetical protein